MIKGLLVLAATSLFAATVGPQNGTLVVIGGGKVGAGISKAIETAAGGVDAPVVFIPTAGEEEHFKVDECPLAAAGFKNITILHTRDRAVSDSDAFVAPLKTAKVVWLGGGRQWRLVDSYLNTKTQREIEAVLARGGVVAGTSAGATIQGSYLVRGAREGNTIMMAPGYEQGFGLLKKVTIDQHLLTRKRENDLLPVIAKHPELLGIGIDESTAIVVRGDKFEVVGESKVAIYDGRPFWFLSAGDRYDLAARKKIEMKLSNLDPDAINTKCKPCDDFFEFATGKWHEENPVPASQARWGKRWASADRNQSVLRDVVETVAAKQWPKGSTEQIVGDYFGSCMNEAAIERAGASPLKPYLDRIAAIQDRSQLRAEITQLATRGLKMPFELAGSPYSEDPQRQIARLAPAGNGLPDRDYYLKTDAKSIATRERYLKHIEKMMTLAGWDAAHAAAAAKTVLAFETKLAEPRLSRVERRDPYATNNHIDSAKLNELAPGFDWRAHWTALGVKYEGLVRVSEPKYMAAVAKMLDEAPLEDWKVYLAWHVVQPAAGLLNAAFRREVFEFQDAYLNGAKEPKPRWKTCVAMTDNNVGEALGKLYVEKVFPAAAKTKMQEIVKNLQSALKETITGLEWMTPETKQKALEKLATFNPKLGYPDRWQDYSTLSFSRDNFWANNEQTSVLDVKISLRDINGPVDKLRWFMTTPTSNAYYNPSANEIVFPAGILVPPMFELSADDAANYGSIGVVIGHEISHGYDDQGSQFDAQGRLKNWWTADDRKQFLAKAQCVVDQFDSYFIEEGTHHNGKLVLGESIGDLAGARIAFAAYMKSLEGKPRKLINGWTPEQRFFLAYAQSRGDMIRIEQQRVMMTTDPHPVSKYRVIGPLSNMPEFHKAWHCKLGDAMVRPPEKQCRVW